MNPKRRNWIVVALGLLLVSCLHTRDRASPQQGEMVPELVLPADDGQTYSLHKILEAKKPVVLVFYRGFW